MTTTTHPAVDEYVGRIQAALADLPESEVEEIVEDIGQHLGEVAGELGDEVSVEALTDRLGTPEQYASELRAAAGYPPAEPVEPPRGGRLVARIALWALILGTALAFLTGLAGTPRRGGEPLGGLLLFGPPLLLALILIFTGRTTVTAVADLPESRAFTAAGRRMVAALPDTVAGYLRSLRPAWWLLRVVLLLGALLLAVRPYGDGGYGVLPALMLVVLLWFGSRARGDARWRWVVTPANAFTIGLGIALLSTAWSFEGLGHGTANYLPQSGLYDDGRIIDNLYLFGPDGTPLPEVYLYDQNGQPIAAWPRTCAFGYPPRTNKFPLPRIQHDSTGCHEDTGVPFTVAIPTPPTK
jgi:hypothetical protein